MPFTDEQIDKMRNELKGIYNTFKSKNSRYSYPTLWDSINNGFEDLDEDDRCFVPDEVRALNSIRLDQKDNFRKFVAGETHQMHEAAMWAIYLWLTDEENGLSGLTRTKIKGFQGVPKVAALLAQYLHEGCDETPCLNASNLRGEYSSTTIVNERQSKFTLILDKSNNENLLSAICHEDIKWRKSDDVGYINYRGFLVIAPNDSLYLMLHNEQELTNHFLFSIGVDDSPLNEEKVQFIGFVDQHLTSYIETEKLFTSVQDMFAQWTSENVQNIRYYKRK